MKSPAPLKKRTKVCGGYFPRAGLWLTEDGDMEYRGLSLSRRPMARFRSDLVQRVTAEGNHLVASIDATVNRPASALLGLLLFTDLDRRPGFYFTDRALPTDSVADIFRGASRLPAIICGERLYLNARVPAEYADTGDSLRELASAENVLVVDPVNAAKTLTLTPELSMQITKRYPAIFVHPLRP